MHNTRAAVVHSRRIDSLVMQCS